MPVPEASYEKILPEFDGKILKSIEVYVISIGHPIFLLTFMDGSTLRIDQHGIDSGAVITQRQRLNF